MSWVGSGEEGLAAIDSACPDFVFLDYKLPGMNGLDVLNRLRQTHKDLLVVMVTAFASLDTAVKATKLGAFDFMSKPFTPDEIRYVVKKVAHQIILSRRARAAEEEKRQIRFQFLSVLAHELKAPLNAIEGYLDLMKDGAEGQNLTMINRSLIRLDGMRKLIFDLLDLTRIESGQKKRELVAVDAISLLKQTMETVEPLAREHNVRVNLPALSEFVMSADAGEIEIIFNNLISNAVKYNKDDGDVFVELSRAGDAVVFSVRDTGIGLSESEMKKLFTEFTRIRNEKTVNIMGSGLGLSTVRKLARLNGGDVSVKSVPGEGSVFTVIMKDSTQRTG
jgi:signal transduction histidine kinase